MSAERTSRVRGTPTTTRYLNPGGRGFGTRPSLRGGALEAADLLLHDLLHPVLREVPLQPPVDQPAPDDRAVQLHELGPGELVGRVPVEPVEQRHPRAVGRIATHPRSSGAQEIWIRRWARPCG